MKNLQPTNTRVAIWLLNSDGYTTSSFLYLSRTTFFSGIQNLTPLQNEASYAPKIIHKQILRHSARICHLNSRIIDHHRLGYNLVSLITKTPINLYPGDIQITVFPLNCGIDSLSNTQSLLRSIVVGNQPSPCSPQLEFDPGLLLFKSFFCLLRFCGPLRFVAHMFATLRILCHFRFSPSIASISFYTFYCPVIKLHSIISTMDSINIDRNNHRSQSFSTSARSSRSGGGGRGSRGRGGGGGGGQDRIDALGRLLTRILRHMAAELKLDMRSDGYVKVQDLLSLNMKTFSNLPISSHTIDDIKEAVRRDNKQRFGLVEENGELLIRANQGHTLTLVETESLLKPILSPEEYPVCVHGTYRKNMKSILESGLKRMQRLHVHFSCGLPTDGEVISGMRRDVNILIFLDIRKAIEGGMKLYISENKVILTEGFEGIVPVEYFERIESWPDRKLIPFQTVISG